MSHQFPGSDQADPDPDPGGGDAADGIEDVEAPATPARKHRSGVGARDAAEREAARLRWELARLRSRRSVRAALLAGGAGDARRGGPRDVLATLRGRRVVEDLDVIEPAVVSHRCPYPHLDIVHLAPARPFGSAAGHRRAEPDDLDALRRQPPDLVVLDDLVGLAAWPADARGALREALPAAGAVLAVIETEADATEAALWPLDLALLLPGAASLPGVESLETLPGIDPLEHNPVGWRREPRRAAVTVAGGDPGLGLPEIPELTDARDAGAVVVPEPTGPRGARTILTLAALGIPAVVSSVATVATGLADLVLRAPAGDLATTAMQVSEDLDARERHSVRVRRRALREHDHRTRLEAVLTRLGVPLRPPERISVLLATRRPAQLLEAVAQVAAQDHPDVELVAALHGPGFADDAEARVAAAFAGPTRVVRVAEQAPLGDVLNAALDAATGTLIAKMDDDDLYGPGHLSDLVLALGYSGADVVGRRANAVHLVDRDVTITQDLDRQERWAHQLPGATLLLPADVLRAVRFRRVPRAIDTHLLRSIHAAGGSAYATHRFGFVRRRHGDHTYARDVEAGHDEARPGLDVSVLDV